MPTVIFDIPAEKITFFIGLIENMGINEQLIPLRTATKGNTMLLPLKAKFLFFDWNCFNNELEFE